MKIILGHTNMDLDCIGSMVLARYLFPDHKLIGSTRVHPVARNIYNLYKNHINFLSPVELKNYEIESIVVVDTRSRQRIKEYLQYIPDYTGPIIVYDHHPADQSDIPDAQIIDKSYGANTTLLGMEIIKKNISINSDDATIALVGIYADTGNFIYPSVTSEDFQVASFLVENNASIGLVKKFLQSLKEEHQLTILHDMMNQLIHQEIAGHYVLLCYMIMEKQVSGLAAVVEKVFELENSDAIFAVFVFEKSREVLIIARSQKDTFEVNSILKPFGGGGHIHAASALVKNVNGEDTFDNLKRYLKSNVTPAVQAEDIMTKKVDIINENLSLMEASIFLENTNHTGAPVVNDSGEMTGFMTLRNIMKGRMGNQMHAPVKAYMNKKVITGTFDMKMREIENIFYNNNIGHLPVIHAGRLVGILTRTDFLNYMSKKF